MTLATDNDIDERQPGAPTPPAAAADDEWFYEDEHGWVRQYQAWVGDGVYVVKEERDFEPMPWHHAVNEGYGLGISVQGAYRRRVRGTDQVVDPNTGFLRYAGDEVGVEHFVGGPGAITFVGVDPGVCPGFSSRWPTCPRSRSRPRWPSPTSVCCAASFSVLMRSPSRVWHSTYCVRRSNSITTASTPTPGERRENHGGVS